jgi:hypothetical protein
MGEPGSTRRHPVRAVATPTMSPIKPAKKRSPRSVAIGVGLFSLGTILIVVLFVLAIPKLTESGKIEVKLGTDTFNAGYAQNLAPLAAEAPILFSDVANGQRDIYLVHTGSDPLQGWAAFDARKPGQPRNCTLSWDREARHFSDPCDQSVVTAEGAGLPRYPVQVSSGEQVVIDIKADSRGTSTTSSIVVTGSTR